MNKTYRIDNTSEFLLGDGEGGYTLYPVSGTLFRKYHGLFTISLDPPIKRTLLLQKLHLVWEADGERVVLTPDDYDVQSSPVHYVKSYEADPFPAVTLETPDLTVRIEAARGYRNKRLGIRFQAESRKSGLLKIVPYITYRDHHDVHQQAQFAYQTEWRDQTLTMRETLSGTKWSIRATVPFQSQAQMSEPYYLKNEGYRGLDNWDQSFIPGAFHMSIAEQEPRETTFAIGMEDDIFSYAQVHASEIERTESLYAKADASTEIDKQLVRAADAFIVDRHSTGKRSVLAGFPWFTDWGRDTMIAMPGLTLSTGRYEDAKEILSSFLAYEKEGILPNMFPDAGQDPLYNTADATLWLFWCLDQYVAHTGDWPFIKAHFRQLERIIQAHKNGTMHNIHVQESGLLWAGTSGTQLTWMDVKVNGWVPTPRHGLAVELNALWYNALCTMSDFAQELAFSSGFYKAEAKRVRDAFQRVFTKPSGGLYDCVRPEDVSKRIRPNQLLAVSLPNRVVTDEQAKGIVDEVVEYLYTPVGIRSLAPTDQEYCGTYGGAVLQRDGCYHQGTAWGWLLGPFVEAYQAVYGLDQKLSDMIARAEAHLFEGCFGSYAEIFDGDQPHAGRGCCAQAWSVSELLRVRKKLK